MIFCAASGVFYAQVSDVAAFAEPKWEDERKSPERGRYFLKRHLHFKKTYVILMQSTKHMDRS